MTTTLRIITRQSPLALRQYSEIMSQLPDVPHTMIGVESFGDQHREISLLDNPPADIFTRELDLALLSGTADAAIHSAKDLPFPLPEGLLVIALTATEDQSDSLVTREGKTLENLPAGSRIGTSSPSRKQQLLQLRPDLVLTGIRGNIDDRIAQVDEGTIDGVIVATCALKRLGLTHRIAEILPFETHPLQGHLAVVARTDRPDLARLFAPLDYRPHFGKVYLTGAGAGTADSLTLQADKALRAAGVIFYDALLDPTLLDRYPGEKIFVGKRSGNHSIGQDKIGKHLAEAVKTHRVVVRLKGGCPLIFGRMDEEMDYLKERMIGVEIIPGITSAQTAAASAGRSLTHRGTTRKVSYHTAHATLELSPEQEHRVYYMGVANRLAIQEQLLAEGLSPQCPVLLAENAGQLEERLIRTTIAALPAVPLGMPALVMVSPDLARFRPEPRVLFTGLDPLTCPSHHRLIHYPLIAIDPIQFQPPADYDAVIFTSKSAVDAWHRQFPGPISVPILAMGDQTRQRLSALGHTPVDLPKTVDSDAFVTHIQHLGYTAMLYPCSERSDNAISTLPAVKRVTAYHTRYLRPAKIDLTRFYGIVFSSSSTAQAFFELYDAIPDHLVVYAYGAPTIRTLTQKGYDTHVCTISPSAIG